MALIRGMLSLMLAWAALASRNGDGAFQVTTTPDGSYSVQIDGEIWASSSNVAPVLNDQHLDLVAYNTTEGSDQYGSYLRTEWQWGTSSGADPTFTTSIRAYSKRELAIFTQSWPQGFQTGSTSPPTPAPTASCSMVNKETDQTGGQLIQQYKNLTNDECCAKCQAESKCDVWVTDPERECFLVNGPKGMIPRADRTAGFLRGTPGKWIIASFPTFNLSTPAPATGNLSYLAWGGCQVSQPMSGLWSQDPRFLPSFNAITSGVPLLLHNEAGRSIVMSSADNFFVGGQATEGDMLECGIRASVQSLPKGFSYSTVVVGGQGINSTMIEWGDLLLDVGKKPRTDPYKDFVLSHVGYWTDNGAFYYHYHGNFSTGEAALNAVKADLAARNIPVRYFQWDDWWMESEGDVPGITSWVPKPDEFPSGFTDWLGAPLSLYAPMYAADSDWADQYKWKTQGKKSAIPLDPKFYLDLFRNGTAIGMQMFEQDFLCTYNADTNLTNSDVTSGSVWMAGMDAAAQSAKVSLQWCMMNPCHALQSTLVKAMTNGRATGDNCRGSSNNIASMGQNGLFYYAVGFFPSRDNVWTTNAETEQTGCNRFCSEPNALADNAVAVLSGGPYGPSDAIGMTNKSVVMRAVRTDGVLIRAAWPLSSLDVVFTRPRESGQDTPLVWAAHDDYDGVGRWSYIVGINLDENFPLTPSELQGAAPAASVAWPVTLGPAPSSVLRFNDDDPLDVPAAPAQQHGPGSTLWGVAPVLPSGLAILGDMGKWATMSTRRFQNLKLTDSGATAKVIGAPGETVVLSYVASGQDDIQAVQCAFPETDGCEEVLFGDKDCSMILTCTAKECKCA